MDSVTDITKTQRTGSTICFCIPFSSHYVMSGCWLLEMTHYHIFINLGRRRRRRRRIPLFISASLLLQCGLIPVLSLPHKYGCIQQHNELLRHSHSWISFTPLRNALLLISLCFFLIISLPPKVFSFITSPKAIGKKHARCIQERSFTCDSLGGEELKGQI